MAHFQSLGIKLILWHIIFYDIIDVFCESHWDFFISNGNVFIEKNRFFSSSSEYAKICWHNLVINLTLIHFKNPYKLSTILINIRTERCIILWTDFSGLYWFSFGISIWSHYEFCIQIITLRAQLCLINKFLSVSQILNKYSLWMKNLIKLRFIWQIKLWPGHGHG